MIWNIEPYIGVGPLKFGMSPKEIESILGPAESGRDPASSFSSIPGLEDKYMGYYTEHRMLIENGKELSKPILTYKNDKLNTIEIWDAHNTLNLNGIYFFRQDMRDVINELIDKSNSVIEDMPEGFIFLDFGISLYNEEYYESGESVAIFERGEFDDFIAEGLEGGTSRYLKGGLN